MPTSQEGRKRWNPKHMGRDGPPVGGSTALPFFQERVEYVDMKVHLQDGISLITSIFICKVGGEIIC